MAFNFGRGAKKPKDDFEAFFFPELALDLTAATPPGGGTSMGTLITPMGGGGAGAEGGGGGGGGSSGAGAGTRLFPRLNLPLLGSGGGGGGGGGGTSMGGGSSGLGSGMGHMCIVMVQPGSTTVSHTRGRMMSPLGPNKS